MNKEEKLKKCIEYFDGDKLAADTFISKYAMEDEETPDDMHHRIAKEYARIEHKFGGENELSEEEVYNLFKDFKYIIPGGSVMSNLGNKNIIGSLSNCFVVGQCKDSYASIMKYRDFQVELMKRRGGVGIDLSQLRPEGTSVNNAAKTSTGPVSFMNCFSELTKEVALNGRRGALMISISGNHPDVEQFIECKQDLTKITGANISVKFSDEFMEAVQNNNDYLLKWPVDTEIDFPIGNEYNVKYWSVDNKKCCMKVHAQDIWNKFVHCAWNTAEPGVMYEDKHINLSPDGVYDKYRGITTNPCVAGDTLIMTDKGQIIVTELLKRFNDGEQFLALTYNTNNGIYSFEKITNVIKTRENTKIIGINTFDGMPMLKLTPDHKVYTQNRGYIEAKYIEYGDILITISIKHNNKCEETFYSLENEDVYDITVENNHNFFANGILVHNCGEIFMGKYDSCRLMHLNLPSFVKDDKTFDYELLEKVSYNNMKLCDDLVELELECVEGIIEHIKSTYTDDNRNELELWENIYNTGKSSRRAGCGATGVADAIALMGIKLNSEEGFNTVEKIFQTKMLGELKAQIDMARERGTFVGYDFHREFNLGRSLSYTGSLHSSYAGTNLFFDKLLDIPGLTKELMKDMQQYGRRNVSWSTMAPVGTGAIMAQGSSGVEPVFKVVYKRRKKCMNNTDRVDYVDEAGEKFTEYNVIHIPFKKWVFKNFGIILDENTDYEIVEKYVKDSPWFGCEASDLTPEEHIRLQSIVQRYITHSISKTVNLPNSATEKDVSDIYMLGWKYSCKGTTCYRDNCRSGVMIDSKTKDCNCKCNTTLTHSAPKRPKSLPCDVKRFKNGGDKWISCVGLYQGQPYEIFTGLAEKLNLPDYVNKCSIIKNKFDAETLNEETGKYEMAKVSRYDLVYSDKNGDIQMIENIGNVFRSEFYNVSKMISALLRHGMPIEYVVSTIKSLDFKNDTINSWKSGVIRTLKQYIKDGEVQGETCPECGGVLIRTNGCISCQSCGWSKCG